MPENTFPPGLGQLIHDLEENSVATQRLLIGILRTLTPQQRDILVETIFELNQMADETIPVDDDMLLARGRSISDKTLALLKVVKED
ncbi:hypothetical protein SJI19_21690 [Acerihabitans sp. TG2]|uniref:hypothetical protein n=1 Tax=Acerihabitans sp. TG2 TaxID=3096008 RepID=UPI002B23DB04|nr:hypothetical protein [Acerihabitans sp. TG2]MEA9393117.1 hypothetical protein [Acerihabitans sp. TG2]